jgi:alkaline phosphatase D
MAAFTRRRWLRDTSLATGACWTGLPAFLPHALAADEPRFAWGVASGEPTHQGMVLWTRLSGPGLPNDQGVPVQWEVAEDEGFTRIVARGTEMAESAWAFSVHAEPSGLAPARPYWYRFHSLGQQSPAGLTRTAPAPDAPARLKLIIASCQRYDMGHYAAWRHAAQWQPDLILFLGDYIYETASPADRIRRHQGGYVQTLAQYRARYAQYKTDPLLQAAHASAPWMVIWDDHEVDNDYAGLQGQRLQPDFAAQRRNAYQAFWEHMPLPMRMRPDLSAPGASLPLYRRHAWGRLAQIHLLDDRQYRDPQACPREGRGGSNIVALRDCPDLALPARSLLGAAQEDWLHKGWDRQRRWNLLAQQTLMMRWAWSNPYAPAQGSYWTDGWDGYPAARTRLLQSVLDQDIRNLVVLGGDVHGNYVGDLKLNADSPFGRVVASEFCGTSITSFNGSPERVVAAHAFNPHVKHARIDERGFVAFEISDQSLVGHLMVVDDALDPNSGIRVSARYAVEAGRPGVQRA